MYEYSATLKRVVDGDTVWLRVDLGFRVFTETVFRLDGINSPELASHDQVQRDAAKAAKEFLNSKLENVPLTVKSLGPDKYGRWLASIYLSDGTSINKLMVDSGHAVEYHV